MPEDRIGELRRGGERLVLVAERAREEEVDRCEHLRAGAIVAAECQQVLGLCPALAEDLDIGVPEAVDRLELVADGEDLGRLGVRSELDQLALEAVRVLELVDHDEPEPQPDGVANGLVVAKQVARRELEVLEVDRRLPPFRGCIGAGEALEQLLQEVAVAGCELLEGRALERLPGELVGGRPDTPAMEARQVDEALGQRRDRQEPEGLARRAPLVVRCRAVRCEALRLLAEPRDRVRHARARPELEHEVAAR